MQRERSKFAALHRIAIRLLGIEREPQWPYLARAAHSVGRQHGALVCKSMPSTTMKQRGIGTIIESGTQVYSRGSIRVGREKGSTVRCNLGRRWHYTWWTWWKGNKARRSRSSLHIALTPKRQSESFMSSDAEFAEFRSARNRRDYSQDSTRRWADFQAMLGVASGHLVFANKASCLRKRVTIFHKLISCELLDSLRYL